MMDARNYYGWQDWSIKFGNQYIQGSWGTVTAIGENLEIYTVNHDDLKIFRKQEEIKTLKKIKKWRTRDKR